MWYSEKRRADKLPEGSEEQVSVRKGASMTNRLNKLPVGIDGRLAVGGGEGSTRAVVACIKTEYKNT